MLIDIPLTDIHVAQNIRDGAYGIEPMVESLRAQGQLEPVMVRPTPDGKEHGKPYELVFGHRRRLAAQTLGWDTIRAQVRDVSDEDLLDLMLTENIQREQLSAIEEAQAIRAMIDLGGITRAECARRLGVSPSHVTHRLGLLDLAPSVRERISGGEITPSHGEALAALPPADQERLATRIARDGASVRRVEGWVRAVQETQEAPEELPQALEEVTPDDAVLLPQVRLRNEVSDLDLMRLEVYILLRAGMDREVLDWLEREQGVPYEDLWSWVRGLDQGQADQVRRMLIGRWVGSAHRLASLEDDLVDSLTDPVIQPLERVDELGELPRQLPDWADDEA